MDSSQDPRVRTGSGVVRGRWRGNSAVFLGIPYAAAPIGDRRFGPPEPAEPWLGDWDAGQPGATPQRHPLAPVTTIPEPSIPGDSTLNLNVYTPHPAPDGAGLPVLVWIHGGGFVGGSPASPWYDGASFSRDGVVTVVISYRLGFDGFGWIQDAPLNRGLMDQIAALEWVQDNIAAFGGDPAAVTIAGQSAGGTCVLTLLAMPGAQDLFGSVICQSGTGRTQSAQDAERLGRQLAAQVGVTPTRTGWVTVDEGAVLDAQAGFGMGPRPQSVDPVAFARDNLFPDGDALAFGPVVDGNLLHHSITDALGTGIGADKPLLIGANAHEFTLVLGAAGPSLVGVDVGAALTRAGLPPDVAYEFTAGHPELAGPELLLGQLLTERMFRLPLLDWVNARTLCGAGRRTWLYDFRWSPPGRGIALHCTEVPFVWDLLGADGVERVLGGDPPRHLADAMHGSWVRFITTGEPGWAAAGAGLGMMFDEDPHERPLLVIEHQLADALAGRLS